MGSSREERIHGEMILLRVFDSRLLIGSGETPGLSGMYKMPDLIETQLMTPVIEGIE